MPECVERLVSCGFNLIDAYEICDDYMYDGDYEGLMDYISTVELEYSCGGNHVGRV